MFEWDDIKNQKNLLKHGVAFEEAITSFSDALGIDGPDVAHSQSEIRYLRIGKSVLHTILTTAYTLRAKSDGTKKIRIISSRKASKKERKAYSEE
jgi:uncharacterized DUF497 family protein